MEHPLDLSKKLQESEQWKHLNEIRMFDHGVSLFVANEKDLIDRLEWSMAPANLFSLWHLQNRPLLDEFQHEVSRLLHNYVASAHTLVDHARHFYNKYYSNNADMRDYQAMVKRLFIDEPEPVFIKGLRNYTMHYGLPPISSKISFSPNSAEHTVLLARAQLLEWDKWPPNARKWMEDQQSDIDLYKIVLTYKELYSKFYTWFEAVLRKIHEEDEKFVLAAQRKICTLEFELHVDSGLVGQMKPENLFYEIVPKQKMAEIFNSIRNPADSADALLDEASFCIDITVELRKKVKALFNNFYATK